jgi:hypothetical protein
VIVGLVHHVPVRGKSRGKNPVVEHLPPVIHIRNVSHDEVSPDDSDVEAFITKTPEVGIKIE